jgi:cytochrome c-type biogenesis protein CcmH/NrfF
MDRQQVRAAFAAWYGGQDILTAPIDKGFNRLAWLFPYVIGVTGGHHWSRRAAVVVARGADG